jgi:hypothetical protein
MFSGEPSQAHQIIFEIQSQKEQQNKNCKENKFFKIAKPVFFFHFSPF